MISQIMILSHIIIIWYWKAQLWSRLNWPTLRSTRDELHRTSVYHVFISSCIHIMSWCLDIVNSAYLSIWTHGWRGWRLPGFSDELVCYTWKYFINIVISMICYTCKSVIIVIFCNYDRHDKKSTMISKGSQPTHLSWGRVETLEGFREGFLAAKVSGQMLLRYSLTVILDCSIDAAQVFHYIYT